VIGVLFGGPTPEHDISILTGLVAVHELVRSGHDVAALYWTKTGVFTQVDPKLESEAFVDGLPPQAEILELRVGDGGGFFTPASRFGKAQRLALDAIIVATHGGPGEDGTIQATLDLAGIAYSGPTVAGAALGMDKWSFGAVVLAAGLPTLPREILTSRSTALPFAGPYILKPRFGGSSIGIDVVEDLPTALARLTTNPHFERGCVVEPYRADLFDVQIAVRSYPDVQLSAIEKPLRRSLTAEILDYRDKYVGGSGMVGAPREIPANLAQGQRAAIEEFTTRIVEISGLRGVARIDFLISDHEIYVNEINTIPGSLAKHLFISPPLNFSELLLDLVREARERPAHRYSSAGSDGLVLRSAGSISAKLA
jgi:D-alanine-D-alanine ligase